MPAAAAGPQEVFAGMAEVRAKPSAATGAGPSVADVLGALDAVHDALLLLDREWRLVHVNAAAEQMLERPAGQLLGEVLWELLPESLEHPTYQAALDVAATGRPAHLLWRHPDMHAFYEQSLHRSGQLVAIVSREVTASHDDAERRRRLSRISEALAAAETPEQVAVVITDLALPLAGAPSGGVVTNDPEPGWVRSLRWVGIDRATATDFGRYPLSTQAPGAEAMRTSEFVWAAREDIARRWPAIAAPLTSTGAVAVAGVPMRLRGQSVGALVLQFVSDSPPDGATTDFLRTVAAVCSQALHRTQRLAAEHEVALTLQRSLLPHVPARLQHLELHARYRPGDPGVEVGGDWYDVVPLKESRVVLLVADVQGHDLGAATVMGQMRSVARAYALEGHPPAALLDRLNRFLAEVTDERIVTVLVVLIDQAARLAVAASAGHPAPLLLTEARAGEDSGDGGSPRGHGRSDDPGDAWTVRSLPLQPGPPLGVVESLPWRETTTALPDETVLLAFTDGLVETRARSAVDGIADLATVLARERADASLEQLVDRALDLTPPGARGDDVAVLAARLRRPDRDRPHRVGRTFPPQQLSVPLARHWAADVLRAWALPPAVVQTAALVLSELVGNAVRNTDKAVTVTLALTPPPSTTSLPPVGAGPALEIGVRDDSHRRPVRGARPADDASSGRGLLLVEHLARSLDVVDEPGGGKTVTAVLDAG